MSRNHLIQESGHLLDESGRLREPGYALRPPFAYDHDRIAAHPLRIKDWDYYLVNDEAFAVALTFSDLGYIGLVSASVIDFERGSYQTTSELVMLPMGRMGLPTRSDEGDVVWQNKRCRVEFAHTGGGRRLSFYMARFCGNDEIDVELLLDREPRDTMVICTPWRENEKAFYYNQKILGMRAQGAFRWGAKLHEFDVGDSFGLLDWGRGVWTYDNVWYWAAAQGRIDGHVVALNLGYGFGDTSAASENMVFVDGVAHKLDEVDMGIPVDEYGDYDYLATWNVTDNEGRLSLVFEPQIDRVDYINMGGIVTSDQHQVFGVLRGSVILDDGSVLTIPGIRGACEHIHNRY